MRKFIQSVAFVFALAAAYQAGAADALSFDEYRDALKQEALSKGYSEAFLTPIFDSIVERKAVVKADRNQPERRLTLDTYLETRVPDWKVEQAVQAYREHYDVLKKISEQYNVQARFIVALWGNESNFGRIQGNHPVMSSLVSLAHEGRRETLFKNQFFAALKILQQGHVTLENFNGSWAGAMGQSQFMPTSFLTYAVDANGDGKKDIWQTEEDVFASIANYLSQEGWNGNFTWGRQVKLSESFNMERISQLEGLSRDRKKTLRDWQALGVTKFDQTALPNVDIKASLILPDGEAGRVYLVYDNFDTLMRWNRSYYFGISVAYLAQRIDKAFNAQAQ
ncbi:lytic murein transglycosylase [Glaciecola sp. XM2]|jgi:membrane-bound lytic murein transglycosylase B|uniref:lytic murein transglycosylase n=1 Tax=Glaciecola sp. XM2 TaxID=1914931 RepID=UPI001BDF5E35|nr:lytic murein transglycosylase [Glaciecola sp. XM2]MBT1450954.1 lytic murein transglycosylase [Glaciecola sp. XM2]